MSLKRHHRVAAALAVAAITVFGMAGTARADGPVTWTNYATTWGLQSGGLIDQGASNSLYTGAGFVCMTINFQCAHHSTDWYDYRQSDGSWVEFSEYDYFKYNENGCLDGNNAYGGGTYGAAYTHSCIASDNNPDQWQHWYEYRDSNGRWYLQNVHTGLFLDGGNGPNGNGQFSSINVYVNSNYGNGDLYQRWS